MQDDLPPSSRQTDVLDPARATALQATLGDSVSFSTGETLPPFFHQLYFWNALPFDQLGRDGHPQVGGLIPDMGLPRRMWAGGRLDFHRELVAGHAATKSTSRQRAECKDGRTGPLGFVTLRHDIYQSDQLCVSEWQDLVYRRDAGPDDPKPVPPIAALNETDRREVGFSSTLLFRYSALTFNGHRIHYDLEYARDVEGYSGLVVHAPLLAQLLVLFAQECIGPLRNFTFRATAPLMHTEKAILCRKNRDFWVRAPDGRQCMAATASAA
ncbi:MAG: acyl dehydratase [Paracoccaceae bacterium]